MSSKTQISPLQVYEQKTMTGLLDTNNINAAYMDKPAFMGTVLAYAFGLRENNVLSLLTGGIGNTEFIPSREYEWNLHAQSDKAIEVALDSPSAVNPRPGYSNQEFKLLLAEKWFTRTDVLVADDGITQVRVMKDPVQGGNYTEYSVQLVSGNPKAFCDPKFLKLGARWSKEFSVVGEDSLEGGGHGYVTPFKLRNQLSTLRKSYSVTREATKSVMVVELFHPGDEKKSTKYWTKLSEWTAMAYWYKELDHHFIYSQYNKDLKTGEVALKDENGRPIYIGAGFREQISLANVREYTKLTYEQLDEYLLDLSYAASKYGGDHKFVALTGKMGMREFDRAIQAYVKGNNITVTNNGTFITGSGDNLTFTGYFSTVKFMNGIELTVKEFPPYDDITRQRALHPITLKPIESYRFTILNFGRKNGTSNIRKVALQDSEEAMWWEGGSVDPSGGVAKSTSTMRSSGLDGYKVHYLSQCGIKIDDPTSCGELILKICA